MNPPNKRRRLNQDYDFSSSKKEKIKTQNSVITQHSTYNMKSVYQLESIFRYVILKFCDSPTLYNLMQVSHQCYEYATDDSLWENILYQKQGLTLPQCGLLFSGKRFDHSTTSENVTEEEEFEKWKTQEQQLDQEDKEKETELNEVDEESWDGDYHKSDEFNENQLSADYKNSIKKLNDWDRYMSGTRAFQFVLNLGVGILEVEMKNVLMRNRLISARRALRFLSYRPWIPGEQLVLEDIDQVDKEMERVWFDVELRDMENNASIIEKLTHYSNTRYIRHICIGTWKDMGVFPPDTIIQTLVTNKQYFPQLRSIRIGKLDGIDLPLERVVQGDVMPLFLHFPRLQNLVICGITTLNLEPICHPNLRFLNITSGELNHAVVQCVFECNFPKLRSLRLDFGCVERLEYDETAFHPLQNSNPFPNLKTLFLKHIAIPKKVLSYLKGATIFEQIELLGLDEALVTDDVFDKFLELKRDGYLQKLTTLRVPNLQTTREKSVEFQRQMESIYGTEVKFLQEEI